MSDNYVTKDIFDANLEAIRALMEASEARSNAMMKESEARTNALIQEIRADMKQNKTESDAKIEILKNTTDAIKRAQDLMLNKMTLILGIMTLAFTAGQFALALWLR